MSLKYSKDFKQSTIQKILMPGGPTIMEMAVKTGAHPTSIRDWMKTYGMSSDMKKTTNGLQKKTTSNCSYSKLE